MFGPEFSKFTPAEHEVVMQIARRAEVMYRNAGDPRESIEIFMDLSATNVHVPLRFDDLLEADDFNFAHDIGGIARHLNRDTGQLGGCFLPRYAA